MEDRGSWIKSSPCAFTEVLTSFDHSVEHCTNVLPGIVKFTELCST
jgi:hypothetical protein